MRTFFAALFFLISVSLFGAISRTQAVSADSNTVTITSTSANDVIIVFAYNGSSATIPTLDGAFTNLDSQTGTSQGFRSGYKVSAGGDTSCGTWTNATQVICHVYAGTSTSAPFVNSTKTAGNSATLTYTGFTMSVTNNTAWIVGFGGARSATAGMNGNTTGGTVLTNRTSKTTANGLDTGATTSTFSSTTLTVTTSGRWLTETIEIDPAATQSTTNGFFQW